MGKLSDAAKKAAILAWKNKHKLQRMSGKTWKCCGLPVEVDHLKAGCNGQAENYGEAIDQSTSHSGEVHMTAKQYKEWIAGGGKAKNARTDGKGGFIVHQK